MVRGIGRFCVRGNQQSYMLGRRSIRFPFKSSRWRAQRRALPSVSSERHAIVGTKGVL